MTDGISTNEIDETFYSKYQDIILKELARNRKRASNPNALFFFTFTDTQTTAAVQYVDEVLKRHARPHLIVDCADKTYRRISEEVVGEEFGRNQRYELHQKFEETVRLGSGTTFVFVMPSLMKGETREGRIQIARELMKILDDAHHDGINTMSDVIIIDRASFLESGHAYLEPYAILVPPIEASFDDWFPAAAQTESRLWSVED